jgi:hypothetical protein
LSVKLWRSSTRSCNRQGLPENLSLAYNLIIEV